MKINKLALVALALGLTFTSCSNDDDTIIPAVPLGDYENGILISHEGNFQGGNGSVAFVSNDFETVETNIFNNVNSNLLGDTAQSIAFDGEHAYIVVNGSNKIEVVNRYTFESIATINTVVINPRYMAVSNGKGYVTAWGDFSDTTDDVLLVVNLETNTISNTIPTSYLPEEIIASNNTVYVTTGIFGFGDKVDVVNTVTDEIATSVTVGNSPNSIQFDANGDVWVLTSENLIEISASDNTITKTIAFDTALAPSKLNYDNNGSFYYKSSDGIYKLTETDDVLPTTAEFSSINFYDMAINNGMLYGVDAGDFTSEGSLKVYDLSTNTEIESLEIGIIPGEVYFN
ncbi:DUF5074 domain-containing protein [Lacinutrix sp.]|uniref:DUF5074 domain-containing protein n=1 Tax=Lacinutrix sp. TaxID=1937692 RepID=UPI0025BFBC55|nr:DUF5074 domain-containing protein [Lacinutrix sp.]